MTYYSLMSLFPALLFGVAVLGFFGQQGLIDRTADYLRSVGRAAAETIEAVTSALDSRPGQPQHGADRAGDRPRDVPVRRLGRVRRRGARAEHRLPRPGGPGLRAQKAHDVAWTLTVIALVLITFVLIFLGGGSREYVFGAIGLGESAAAVWRFARWPLAVLPRRSVYAVVYFAAPNVEVPHFRWITPGAAWAS